MGGFEGIRRDETKLTTGGQPAESWGHNIPESHGGATNINNLKPICARCNLSMGNYYSIEEWSKMGQSIQQNIPQSINKNSVKWPSATPTTAPTTTTIPAKKPWLICC